MEARLKKKEKKKEALLTPNIHSTCLQRVRAAVVVVAVVVVVSADVVIIMMVIGYKDCSYPAALKTHHAQDTDNTEQFIL